MGEITRLSIFPLAGALLFPRMQLPLHIFEPRYRALVSDAMARDRRIGMIQPRGDGDPPPLFDIGCVGRIAHVEALDDGRYNIVLEGVAKFRLLSELPVTTPFRQIEAELEADEPAEPLPLAQRAALEEESRRYADAQGYAVDWNAVSRLDDESLVNGIAQIAPFDAAAKQALLEAPDLQERTELVIQLMQFFSRHAGDHDDPVTLQ
ncbi:LON peptidase substrate-binding domain-containing protein [Sphingomonas sp.]|uniref:LON peptidase substrate-binding domain-containing protein n=1 Tax=Sphingomonas sp. TaxID=28214 RepID=UPI002DB790FB|nr:LON peptidase substrate-binding domain-containing protein [Sphingomonas sp.]HEU4970219.1 LON peptidase substrate-binding domain-containing protein [Sphingomonas sp.]